ncbi:MAG TPA: aminodeoxychorismate/anthranilate synthase component II [Clostridia bacterium]|nr:aminodeoxychorismate/anthranilate synthase component II [Clostridia bacterium]
MILLIDNYDSFTYNIYQYLSEFMPVITIRNDQITINEIKELNPQAIVISPGPKTPYDAGLSIEIITEFYNKIPILGICLGHQCIGVAFNSKVSYAKEVIHGKTSLILNNQKNIFEGLDKEIKVARYHSLAILRKNFSDQLEITAETMDGEIMAVKHKMYPVYGLQFHPESINTKSGKAIIKNFIKEVRNVS